MIRQNAAIRTAIWGGVWPIVVEDENSAEQGNGVAGQ
jgi:hypothetical protein